MTTRWRAAAWMPLLTYLAALVFGPALHERHHASDGADHEHFAGGTVYFGADASHTHSVTGDRAVLIEHERFDDDLLLLDLATVAEAGTLSVDCALAEYTLATCALDQGHAHRFGDGLASPPSRSRRSHTTPDLEHHRFSVEHLAAPALVAVAPTLAPMRLDIAAAPLCDAPRYAPTRRPLRSRSRAPPVV